MIIPFFSKSLIKNIDDGIINLKVNIRNNEKGEVMNKNSKKSIIEQGEITIFTKEGDKLIGIIVDPKILANLNPKIAPFIGQEGIWLKRENKITFLGNDNIKSIRKSKPFEKELDQANP